MGGEGVGGRGIEKAQETKTETHLALRATQQG